MIRNKAQRSNGGSELVAGGMLTDGRENQGCLAFKHLLFNSKRVIFKLQGIEQMQSVSN